MTTTREEIAAEARRWIATPYAHQGRRLGVGVDCGCLVAAVAVACGVLPATWWEMEFPKHAGYARTPAHGKLESVCDAFMERIPVDDADVGDVLGFRFRRSVQHLGIVVPYAHGGLAVVHALAPAGKVAEHVLDDAWRARAVIAWRLPGVTA